MRRQRPGVLERAARDVAVKIDDVRESTSSRKSDTVERTLQELLHLLGEIRRRSRRRIRAQASRS
jgi:hypothetical protein